MKHYEQRGLLEVIKLQVVLFNSQIII